MTNREEWLSAKIAYINGLKSPSEQDLIHKVRDIL